MVDNKENTNSMDVCPNCGVLLSENSLYCPFCRVTFPQEFQDRRAAERAERERKEKEKKGTC